MPKRKITTTSRILKRKALSLALAAASMHKMQHFSASSMRSSECYAEQYHESN